MPRFPLQWSMALFLAGVCAWVRADSPPREHDAALISSRIEDRLLKKFDFDEQKLGNYESIPRGWRQIREPGHPRFLTPRFDPDLGHDAPPSFRFSLSGGSLGAAYLARDIDVHPNAEYQVSGWIRSSGLRHARACLTACYMDAAFRKIPGSERLSEPVGGEGRDDEWTQVSVRLPAGHENARWIGLSCLVEQSAGTAAEGGDLRPIDHSDVRATAWFDDIMVLRLPRATLQFSDPAAVFAADDPVECQVRVADISSQGVTARLEIADARGRIVRRRSVPVVGLEEAGVKWSPRKLPAGWYKAVLSVDVGEGITLTQERSFVRLNPDLKGAASAGSGFGLILDKPGAIETRVCERLVSATGCGALKIPLWRRDLDDAAVVNGDTALDGLLRRLQGRDLMLVGVLESPPESLARLCGHPKLGLLDVLSRPAEEWRPYLAFVSTHYGRRFAAWQVGADDGFSADEAARLPAAVANVRSELKPLIGSAELVVPQSSLAAEAAPAPSGVEVLSVQLPSQTGQASVVRPPTGSRGDGEPRKWAVVEPLPAERYGRLVRLSGLARSMVAARVDGFDAVFAPQPWSARKEESDTVVSPEEDLIVLRTLSQSLASLRPATPVWIGHGLRAWLFADAAGARGAVVVWTDGDDAPATRAVLDVGPAARQIDLWANVTATEAADGGRAFLVGAAPTIISPVDPTRVRTLASFAVAEPTLQACVDQQRRTVTLSNPRATRLHGTLKLDAPPTWRIEPSKTEIDIPPGGQAKVNVELVLPINQAAGEFSLAGRLLAEGQSPGEIALQAPLSVESPGLDVSVLARREGQGVEVLQRITNRTEGPVTLRGLLIAPDCPRQTQTVRDLPPGDTVIRRYMIASPAKLVGRPIRVLAEQVDGPLRHNTLIVLD
jgi:hypothetical protein